MKALVRLAIGASAVLGLTTLAAPVVAGADAPAYPGFTFGPSQVVFVQTDNLAGNQVVAYDRGADGSLHLAGTYDTGGLGGQLTGSVVDHLASQGSLAYDPHNGSLYAVNAGSNTVSVFAVRGDRLFLRQVVGSGGTFPVSIAVHGSLVYVLNAENGASVQGFVGLFGHLFPLPKSARALDLNPAATPQFVNTPGQVAFSPDGSQLIVTTKANGNAIDVFRVGWFGYLSATPVVNAEPGTVPFAISFDSAGHLLIAEAGTNALATFALNPGGTVSPVSAVGTGQSATCWVASAQGFFYVSNAGSASVSRYTVSTGGTLSLGGQTATDPGTVDAAASADGQYLYVQTGGNGIVDEFRVNPGGALTGVGSVTVAGAIGGEGIVAF